MLLYIGARSPAPRPGAGFLLRAQPQPLLRGGLLQGAVAVARFQDVSPRRGHAPPHAAGAAAAAAPAAALRAPLALRAPAQVESQLVYLF